MKNNFRESISWDIISTILGLTVVCLIMLSMRAYMTGKFYYLFLVWNLLLAIAPLIFAMLSHKSVRDGRRILLIIPFGFLWFIFFPNAPYIVTDFIHLRQQPPVPLWYDATMLFTFAITGLLSGLSSLSIIHKILQLFINNTLAWLVIIFITGLSAYGIFIGRILRYNSWDIFIRPVKLMHDSIRCLDERSAIIMTLMFSALIILPYVFLFIKEIKPND